MREIDEMKDCLFNFREKINGLNFYYQKMLNCVLAMEKSDLRKRGKVKYMKLTEDVQIPVTYSESRAGSEEIRKFSAGTLIDCNEDGWVYLDDDGDGNLYFPPEKLVLVEVDMFDSNIKDENIIHQG